MKKSILKKVILLILIVLMLSIIMIIGKRLITPITYSNLATQGPLNYTVKALENVDIPTESIDTFRNQVEFTNNYLKELPNLQGEFLSKRGTVVNYDENLTFNMFISVKLQEDLNCRVATWNLIKDKVEATPLDGDIEYSEQNILDFYPYTGFSDGDMENFWSVFKGIEADSLNTTKGYAKIIQNEWNNRGVSFKSSDVSLISCFAYASDNKWLEAVHAGVMINVEDGVIFIEKYNPKAPFQVSKFKTEKQVRYYLEQRLLKAFILQPIIMKNDILL